LTAVLLLAASLSTFAEAPPKTAAGREDAAYSEYQIKAAFIYKFATFVEWPKEALPPAEAPFKIGVLGKDPFHETLEQTLGANTIKDRKTAIERSSDPRDLLDCQIVFIADSESGRIKETIELFKGHRILTVGDMDGFAVAGGIINLVNDGKKIRFEVNVDAARRAALKVSSSLLQLAQVVKETEPEEP
jgi:hypothetical protein